MTQVLLDVRTINAVLNALNQPINNATEACAIVRTMALEGGLKPAEDPELSEGHFEPWLSREAALARAVQAVTDYEEWCQVNEAQWSGWGDQIIPEGAVAWTKQAKNALAILTEKPAASEQEVSR